MFRSLILALAIASPALAETRSVAMGERSYLIDMPDQLHPPLIVALHGGGGNPAQFARTSGLSAPANAAGYAVIYPAGTGRRFLTWNAGYCCAGAARSGVDDLAFLDAVIADATARFGLDTRVYLTGMSNGSMLAEAYAATRRVKAVAGVAGTLDSTIRPRFAVPLLHIHGTADTHVRYGGGAGPDSFVQVEFAPVDDVMAGFAARFAPLSVTDRQIDPADDGMSVTQTDHSDASGAVQLRLLTVHGGGHAWPGGSRAGRQGGTQDIDANTEILRFFALHP